MTPLRKQAVAWFLVLSAVVISSLVGTYLFLQSQNPTDLNYVETHLKEVGNFDVEGARKAEYTDEQIAAFIMKRNQAEFDVQWKRPLAIIGAVYLILAPGILASTLRREAANARV